MDSLLTTQQAAERLKISQPRIYQLISEGHLPAQKFGRDYMIREDDLRLVENRPKVGRPPKVQAETSKANKKGKTR
ncbi:MAG: helix-turn-helix domain-containing protein [Pyrinomonadaceae bacterium]